MDAASLPAPRDRGSRVAAILVGGLAAGGCDLIFANLYFPGPWQNIWRFVASGALGPRLAFGDATWPVAAGIGFHFVIAIGAAAVFVAASRRLPVLVRGWGVPGGLAYGVVVYAVMKWFIVPASAIVVSRYLSPPDWGSVLGHMFFVGLPIALATRWLAPARCAT